MASANFPWQDGRVKVALWVDYADCASADLQLGDAARIFPREATLAQADKGLAQIVYEQVRPPVMMGPALSRA